MLFFRGLTARGATLDHFDLSFRRFREPRDGFDERRLGFGSNSPALGPSRGGSHMRLLLLLLHIDFLVVFY